ncbi:hypothetical protein EMCRGX_G000556 [Ephydatia muelleri]
MKRFRLCRRPDIALVSAGGAGQLLGKQQRDSHWNTKIDQKLLGPTDKVRHGYTEGSAHKLQSQRSLGCQRHTCDPTYTNGISRQGPTGTTRSSNRCCN